MDKFGGETIKRVLEREMKKKNLKPANLANYLGTSRTTISNWLQGTRQGQLEYKWVEKLARLFDLKGEEWGAFMTDLGYSHVQREETDVNEVPVYVKRVLVLFDGLSAQDKNFAQKIISVLKKQNYYVESAEMESEVAQLREADWVLALLTPSTTYNESFIERIVRAYEITRENYTSLIGLAPRHLQDIPQNLANLLTEIRAIEIDGLRANTTLNQLMSEALQKPVRPYELEMSSGAIPLNSKFYVERPADALFRTALGRQDSAILLKGARQVGKTSLLARGLQQARESDYLVLLTDFQRLGSSDLISLENFFLAIGGLIAAQLQSEVYPQDMWQPNLMPNFNFDRYIREYVLKKTDRPVLWAMDETDKILACPFRDDIFALFRSWHSDRVLQPHEPCNRLTLALAYSTEPYLFIKDLNQSPFNIGTKIFLEDFTLENVRELNSRYGSPLYQGELEDFLDFTGGQPYLVRCSLNEMVTQELNFSQLVKYARHTENSLTDHLKRLLLIFSENKALRETVKHFVKNNVIESYDDFFRLRSAGIIVGSQERPRFRCRLYRDYLANL